MNREKSGGTWRKRLILGWKLWKMTVGVINFLPFSFSFFASLLISIATGTYCVTYTKSNHQNSQTLTCQKKSFYFRVNLFRSWIEWETNSMLFNIICGACRTYNVKLNITLSGASLFGNIYAIIIYLFLSHSLHRLRGHSCHAYNNTKNGACAAFSFFDVFGIGISS